MRLSDSRLEMDNGICLYAHEVVQSVDRGGIEEMVAYPPGSLDTVRRGSMSPFNEYTEVHLCDTSATTSNGASTPVTNLHTRDEPGIVLSHGQTEGHRTSPRR